MSIAQFLGAIGPSLATEGAINNIRLPGPIGGFGGGTFDLDGRQVTPVDRFLGPVDAQQAQAPQQAPARPKRGGVKDFLGRLGDALMVGAGGEPIYSKKVEREQLGEALARYLGTNDPRLAELVRAHPETFATMFNAQREDKRFDRAAGQDDRRIGVAEGQLGLGNRELDERIRSNQAGEGITQRGQDVQIRIQQLRMQDASLDRQAQAALARGDQQAAMQLEQLRQQNRLELARLGGTDAGYEETTVETEGEPAKSRWFGPDEPAKPATKTVTRRPIRQTPQAAPSQADLEYTAKKHGITVAEVKRRLGVN